MCGITGYIGHRDSVPVLLKGLRRLEYRGYDSAGIALLQDNKIAQLKKAGKVSDLQSLVDDSPIKGNCGIAHTRWATHGAANTTNARAIVLLDHCHAQAKLRSPDRGVIPARASADNYKIEIGFCHSIFS